MGIVTKRHYAASKLPDDLREGIPEDALVSVTVAEERRSLFSAHELEAQIEAAQEGRRERVAIEEAVDRVRDLRNEWDD